MSDTPRTDLMVEHAPIGLRTNAAFEQSCDLCRTLERELNAAIKRIDFVMDCNADVKRIAMERNKAIERIKHLEESGDALSKTQTYDLLENVNWRRAKEAKP